MCGDVGASVRGGQVEIRVALVVEVRVLQETRMVAYDSSGKENIVQDDCAPQASGWINPRNGSQWVRCGFQASVESIHRVNMFLWDRFGISLDVLSAQKFVYFTLFYMDSELRDYAGGLILYD